MKLTFIKCLPYFLISFLIYHSNYGQTRVFGKILSNENAVNFFKPFPEIVNEKLPTIVPIDANKTYSINFSQSNPSFFKITGKKPIFIFSEPNDQIEINIDENGLLEIKGNNYEGNYYYNTHFDYPKLRKFDGIRDIFSNNYKETPEKLITLIQKEFKKETFWVDSLFNLGKVTPSFAEYSKYQIEGTLGWETKSLIDRYYPVNKNESFAINQVLKERLVALIDVQNEKLFRTFGGELFYTSVYLYYKGLNFKQYDYNQIIIDEVPSYSLAPEKFRKYIWGTCLITYINIAPAMYDYCELLTKYKNLYGSNEITEYCDQKKLCSNSYTDEISFLEPKETDFLSFVNTHFTQKRVFIDLWATWCKPCMLEFANQPKDFHDLLKKYNINPVYITIDESPEKEKWKTLTHKLNLKGTNVFMNSELIKSMNNILNKGEGIPIPRYILVDEFGKILSKNTERPSDPKIRETFERFFKSK